MKVTTVMRVNTTSQIATYRVIPWLLTLILLIIAVLRCALSTPSSIALLMTGESHRGLIILVVTI